MPGSLLLTQQSQSFVNLDLYPFALRDAVEHELDRLLEAGVVAKVNFSEWAAPIVVVPKKDHRVRICGDYKVTINPVLEVDQYPLPHPVD